MKNGVERGRELSPRSLAVGSGLNESTTGRTAWVKTHATGTGKRGRIGVMRNMHENLHNMLRDMQSMHVFMHFMHPQKAQAGGENQNANDGRANACGNGGPLKRRD